MHPVDWDRLEEIVDEIRARNAVTEQQCNEVVEALMVCTVGNPPMKPRRRDGSEEEEEGQEDRIRETQGQGRS